MRDELTMRIIAFRRTNEIGVISKVSVIEGIILIILLCVSLCCCYIVFDIMRNS